MKKNDLNLSLNTRDKLISTGVKLFSKFGYDGTTLRMIVNDAGVNISAISFHFGSKENFYKAVLEYVAEDAAKYYEDFYNKFVEVKEEGSLDKDKSLELIEELLCVQLHIAINLPRPDYISLLNWEQAQPPEGGSPFTNKVSVRIEDSFAYLLTNFEPKLDYRKAIIISRFINGGIIAFSEHPAFINNIKKRIEQHQTEDFIRYTLKKFILDCITECCKS